MPPMMMMPPPQKQGGGFIRGIFVSLALTIFSLSLILNLYLFVAVGVSGGANAIQEQVIKEGNDDQRVAVLPVTGTILEGSQERFKKLIDTVKKDKRVKAVVIEIDSPGGTVTASDDIRRMIEQYRKDKGEQFPVVVSMGSVAASGGYYIATAGNTIFASPTTLTGSIGVRMDMYNVAELAKKWGISETTITAPVNGMKNAGSSFKPMTKEEEVYFQGIIDDAYGRFKDLVKKSRTGKIKSEELDQVCSARIFTANQALSNGLVDQIGYFDEAYMFAATQAGLSKPKVYRLNRQETLLDLLGAQSKAGPAGVNIHVDSSLIRDLEQPRLMYLWKP
jgi:protease-4